MAEFIKNIEVKIKRYDPESGKEFISTYTVPVYRGMTVLDALLYIKDNVDGSLNFRYSCRMGICGSCGVLVNGKPMLACYTQILHLNADSILIEPLPNMSTIKDLVVDVSPFFNKYRYIKPYLIRSTYPQHEILQKPEDHWKYWNYTLCIKCAVCYAACPASIDDKFLGPTALSTMYRFNIDTRDEGVKERVKISEDNIWLCTSCHSCTLHCPKEIDSSNSITELRSIIVEGGFVPKTVRDVLSNTFLTYNPWGMPSEKRADWIRDLNVKLLNPNEHCENLYFVCCGPAYDVRCQEIARSTAYILNSIGLSYGILGVDEWCCGDHMLRLGEKGLFEFLAEHNIQAFRNHNVKNIITNSPHCFNVFKNEKPYSSLTINVKHYTQVFAEALRNGLIKPSREINARIAYHDPCFLGKRNKIFEEPREILQSIPGVKLVEMNRNRENSFCCGGGGGRVWTEEASYDKRPSVNRVKEALNLNVDIIATACPFCIIMLTDAVKALGLEDRIMVRDVGELLKLSLP
jgi:succinate dehydrogenase/fumarate reductase iron-sulfur protein